MEGRNNGIEQAEAAGHLLAELHQVRDDLRHNKLTEEQARARVAVIRKRARCGGETARDVEQRPARSPHFEELAIQWDALIMVAEKLKEDFERHRQPDLVH
jgi:hypothetical protein